MGDALRIRADDEAVIGLLLSGSRDAGSIVPDPELMERTARDAGVGDVIASWDALALLSSADL